MGGRRPGRRAILRTSHRLRDGRGGWQLGEPDLIVDAARIRAPRGRPGRLSQFRRSRSPGTGDAVRSRLPVSSGRPRRASRQHPRRSDARLATSRCRRSRAGIRRVDSPFGRLPRGSFPRLDTRPGASARRRKISRGVSSRAPTSSFSSTCGPRAKWNVFSRRSACTSATSRRPARPRSSGLDGRTIDIPPVRR